jgi:hypothetical protein
MIWLYFIISLSIILRVYVHHKGEFQWDVIVQNDYEWLKNKVIENLVLTLLDFGIVFQVDCDANGTTT